MSLSWHTCFFSLYIYIYILKQYCLFAALKSSLSLRSRKVIDVFSSSKSQVCSEEWYRRDTEDTIDDRKVKIYEVHLVWLKKGGCLALVGVFATIEVFLTSYIFCRNSQYCGHVEISVVNGYWHFNQHQPIGTTVEYRQEFQMYEFFFIKARSEIKHSYGNIYPGMKNKTTLQILLAQYLTTLNLGNAASCNQHDNYC